MTIADFLKKKYSQAKNFVTTSPRLNFVDRANNFVNSNKRVAIPEWNVDNASLKRKIVPGAYNMLVRPVVNSALNISLNSGLDIGRTIADPNLQYNQLKSPITKLGWQGANRIAPQATQGLGINRSKNEALGNVGQIGMDVANVYMPKVGTEAIARIGAPEVAKLGFKSINPIKSGIIQGGKQGLKIGSAYGLGQGLDENRNKGLNEQLGNALQSGIIGGVGGAVIGGAVGGATPIIAKGGKIIFKGGQRTLEAYNVAKNTLDENGNPMSQGGFAKIPKKVTPPLSNEAKGYQRGRAVPQERVYANKEGDKFIQGTYNGKPYTSDAYILEFNSTATPPKKAAFFNDPKKVPTQEVIESIIPKGNLSKAEVSKVYNNGGNDYATLKSGDNELIVQRKYYDYFHKKYPNAEFSISSDPYKPVLVTRNGEKVGLIMPIDTNRKLGGEFTSASKLVWDAKNNIGTRQVEAHVQSDVIKRATEARKAQLQRDGFVDPVTNSLSQPLSTTPKTGAKAVAQTDRILPPREIGKTNTVTQKLEQSPVLPKDISPNLAENPKNVSLPQNIPPTTPEVNTDPVQKIITALKEAKPLSGEQKTLNTQLRKQQFAKMMSARNRTSGEQGYFAELGALKGGAKKVDFGAIRPQLTQTDVDLLFNKVNDANIGDWEKINAKASLTKLLSKEGGSIPTGNELKLLNDVFGSDFTKAILDKRSTWQKFLEGGQEVLNLPRAMMASFDLSAPLRQGVFLVGRPKQWAPAVVSMFKQAGSEKAFKAVQENIATRPTYKLMRDARLALTDMSPNMAAREETFMSNLGEKIPVLKYGIKASNRAYTGFLNKLRADTFDDMVKKADSLGLDTKQIAPDIAKLVNSATGRGDLGALNRAAVNLNSVFFSPRLMASRLNLLNPAYYASLDPFVRKEAIKSLLTFGAVAGTTLGLAKAGGAGVGVDPRSADFGKIKVGDTRYDILGGFQQYAVLASRLISGKMVSSTTGKEISLTEGYKPTTRKDIVINFLQSKENPILSFATGLAEGTDTMGQKFNVAPEVINRFIPMVAQDINDLINEDKGFIKSIGMALPGQFGVGVQTYGTQIPTSGKTPTGKSNIQWTNPPDIGQKIINGITGQQTSNLPQDQIKPLQIARQQELQMKADVSNAVAKVTKQIQKGETINGVTALPDGRGLYVTDEGIKYADTPEEAQLAIEKDKFKSESGSFKDLGNGMVLRKNKAGDVTDMSKISYDHDLNTAKLTSLKANKDYKGYIELGNKQLDNIDQQLNDPTLDDLEKQKLLNEGNTLAMAMAKYQSYGGFTKGKSAKSGKAKKGATIKMSTSTDTFASFKPKISLIKPTLKALKVTGGTSGTFRRPSAGTKGTIKLKRGA